MMTPRTGQTGPRDGASVRESCSVRAYCFVSQTGTTSNNKTGGKVRKDSLIVKFFRHGTPVQRRQDGVVGGSGQVSPTTQP
jgi:hypothetical protein